MSLFIIILVSLLASALTLISGFGLGTLLLPVFAIFFPIDVAVATSTARTTTTITCVVCASVVDDAVVAANDATGVAPRLQRVRLL